MTTAELRARFDKVADLLVQHRRRPRVAELAAAAERELLLLELDDLERSLRGTQDDFDRLHRQLWRYFGPIIPAASGVTFGVESGSYGRTSPEAVHRALRALSDELKKTDSAVRFGRKGGKAKAEQSPDLVSIDDLRRRWEKHRATVTTDAEADRIVARSEAWIEPDAVKSRRKRSEKQGRWQRP